MKMHRLCCLVAALVVAAAAPARAADTSVIVVAISGTVTGSPESVVFSGEAKLANRLSPDPDFNSPTYVLTVDMSGVTGLGSLTLKKYVVPGPELLQKKVAASHVVDIAFPFEESGSRTLGARSGMASFTIKFDTASGVITAASGSIGSISLQ